MEKMTSEMEKELVAKAVNGDNQALEQLWLPVQNQIFTLAIRMLADVEDARDALQDIFLKVYQNLASFKAESRFSTWAYRIGINTLLQYRKGKFAHMPLDFEFYGNDIRYANPDVALEVIDETTCKALAEELKLSCTNVMLQCLDSQNRCIFILGSMFHVDSKTGGELMGMTAENFRQHLSRSRRKMNAFLHEYCGLAGGMCNCEKRVPYALATRRVSKEVQPMKSLTCLPQGTLLDVEEKMEHMDALAQTFEDMPMFEANFDGLTYLKQVMQSDAMKHIQKA